VDFDAFGERDDAEFADHVDERADDAPTFGGGLAESLDELEVELDDVWGDVCEFDESGPGSFATCTESTSQLESQSRE
jgi:hypothetical protein